MELREFFEVHSKAALGFSGGVDSAYLLWAARQCSADVRPYFIRTPFQPAFELADAKRLTEELSVELTVIDYDILTCPAVVQNPPDRCYHCKTVLFSLLKERAAKDGYTLLLDGTNASDQSADRPGMRALQELEVCSPLRECGLTKTEIRRRSKKAGLFTWDKPAYACLATRVPTGEPLTAALLEKIQRVEDALFSMGFSDFRVRVFHDAARIQILQAQWTLLTEKRQAVLDTLKPDFPAVLLDLETRDS